MALTLAAVTGGCASLFFHPSKERYAIPALEEAAPEDVWCDSTGGVRLHGLRVRPPDGTPRGTIVFFHGNAENVRTHLAALLWLARAGYQIVAFDYRGYGLSSGEPGIPGVNEDGIAVLDAVFRMDGVDPAAVAVLGQSLGGAIAVYAVARSPHKDAVKALIVDSAFAGYRRIVREKLQQFFLTWPFAVPASWTVDDKYSPERVIGTISPVPVVIIHGTSDPVVPFADGEELYRRAGEPKGFWAVEGAGHVGGLSRPEVRRQLLEFLESVVPRPAGKVPPPH